MGSITNNVWFKMIEKKILFATSNSNKVAEIQHSLPSHIQIISLKEINCTEDIPETQNTIEGNSLQKAQYIEEHYGIDCFAEDTGLEVEALNGEPGVLSARYAGEERDSEKNMQLILEKLGQNINRKARFKTVITLIENGKTNTFEGILEGEIGYSKVGCNGFGYDPIFKVEGGKTLAELPIEEKNLISHRGKAVKKLINYLESSIFIQEYPDHVRQSEETR